MFLRSPELTLSCVSSHCLRTKSHISTDRGRQSLLHSDGAQAWPRLVSDMGKPSVTSDHVSHSKHEFSRKVAVQRRTNKRPATYVANSTGFSSCLCMPSVAKRSILICTGTCLPSFGGTNCRLRRTSSRLWLTFHDSFCCSHFQIFRRNIIACA